MKCTLSGIITDLFAPEIRGNFEKRVFRLKQTDRERYPQHWELEATQGDVNLLDGFKTGDEVTCDVTVMGRAWTKDGRTMIFNTLRCTDIAYFGSASAPKPVPSTRQQTGGIPPADPALAKKQAINKDTQAGTGGWKKPDLPEIDF